MRTKAYRRLSNRAMLRTWWTEVQAPGAIWPRLVDTFGEDGNFVMVDHFGLPSGPDCPGIAALRTLDPACVSLKLSAPYRQSNPHYLRAVDDWLKDRNAPDILWGSDWPWTQNEGQHSYRDCLDWAKTWENPEWQGTFEGQEVTLGFTTRKDAS